MTLTVNDGNFQAEVLESSVPVIVDFWAPWCGPCKALAPVFETTSMQFPETVKFAKVNIDETEIAQQYNIRSVPTLLMFKSGKVVGTLTGNQPTAKLIKFVEDNK